MLVAVDTGGTKTLVAVFRKDGTVKDSIKFLTPPSVDDYVGQLVDSIKELVNAADITTISVAVPGQVRAGVVKSFANLPWKRVDIADALKPHFSVPIFVENDANLAGLAETKALPHTPATSLYVTISTGIGTAIIVEGRLIDEFSASEGGHAVVEYNGIHEEWECFASGKAIYKTYGKYARDITSRRTWHEIADKISRGFLAIVPVLQPEVVIIGGSIGTYFEHYGDHLEKLLSEKLPADLIHLPTFVQAKHPEEAVIYGCYYYAIDRLADQ